jgi:hypothetical protein
MVDLVAWPTETVLSVEEVEMEFLSVEEAVRL